jgi:transposase
MSTLRPDNTERNGRIIDLARQGKAPADIARELGISRGAVSGVIRRARDSGTLATAQPLQFVESREAIAAQNSGEEQESRP